MRITIDAAGGDIAPWVAALRAQAQGEEIDTFESGKLASVLGAQWLDFKLRGTDVFHASTATPCAPRGAKLTATIEDLHMTAAHRFAERILESAHGLIAVSESIRQDAIRLLGIDAEKITTIYPGVAIEYFDAKPARRERPYVMHGGNFDTLQTAWRTLNPELQRDYDLLPADTHADNLPGLLAGATLFVYPALYNGFALPVAQAMAAHVAVVTSNVSSMPEVGRDAAVMVDPHDPEEIAAGITRLLESDDERAKLARYGRARAEKYRWEKCAAESLAFFRRVAGG
jgi:glycosyltransferase involved in cell wall biosynthesis